MASGLTAIEILKTNGDCDSPGRVMLRQADAHPYGSLLQGRKGSVNSDVIMNVIQCALQQIHALHYLRYFTIGVSQASASSMRFTSAARLFTREARAATRCPSCSARPTHSDPEGSGFVAGSQLPLTRSSS